MVSVILLPLSVDPVSGRLLVNDVGNATWEEINDAYRYRRTKFRMAHQRKACKLVAAPASSTRYMCTPPTATDPPPQRSGLCDQRRNLSSMEPTSNYPSTYNGKYFFLDYCGSWIDYITPSQRCLPHQLWLRDSVQIMWVSKQGPDGNLYYLRIGNSTLYKIVYAGGTSAPIITTQPANQWRL